MIKFDDLNIREDLHTEIKSFEGSHRYESLMTTICAFLNTDGGNIYLGIRGNLVIGIEDPKKAMADIDSMLLQEFIQDIYNHIEISIDECEREAIIIVSVKKAFPTYLTHVNGNYYFRVGARNQKSNAYIANYLQRAAIYDLPKYKDQLPSDPKLRNRIKKSGITIESIGNLPTGPYLYKYMDLESALRSIDGNSLRFVEPTNWEDQYEGRFYNAKFLDVNRAPLNPDLTPFLYACCFTTKPENEAAWILYSHNRKGLASRCVQFRFNRKKLLERISNHVINSLVGSLYYGRVEYLKKIDIDNLHHKRYNATLYQKYFDNFNMRSYLNLLLLKRDSFEHEKEIRIFIVPNSGKIKTRRTKKGRFSQNGKMGKKIKPQDEIVNIITWSDLIDEVKIDKNCSPFEKQLLIDKLKNINPNIPIDENYDPYEDKSLKKGAISIKTN